MADSAPLRILFASSDTGAGHRSAASAIDAALQRMHPCHTAIIDVLHSTTFPLLCHAPSIYHELSTHWLPLYNLSYHITNGYWQINALSGITLLWSQSFLARVLSDAAPHIIVCTHPLVLRLLTAVRRIYRLAMPIVAVVTDLVSLHAAWTCTDIDHYMVPTEETLMRLYANGIPIERIHLTGFPVHPKFTDYTATMCDARKALGIDATRFTVLVTSGGVGAGNIRELVYQVEQEFPAIQLLIVTGNNHTLYHELRTATSPTTHRHVYGFVTNMEVLMTASNCVVTKAGPGTLMEALTMRRPAIVTQAVGVQEEGNISLLLQHNMGVFCPTITSIVAAIGTMHHTSSASAAYVATIQSGLPHHLLHGADNIARLVLSLVSHA